MTDITHPRRRISADEFYRLYEVAKQKIELIEGDVYTTTKPDATHQTVVDTLSAILTNFTIGHSLGEVSSLATDVCLDEHNVVQPDLYFVAHTNANFKRQGAHWYGVPDWVIEVLAPQTAKRDRILKPPLYARFGVREYWIIDAANRLIETYYPQGGTLVLSNIHSQAVNALVLPEFNLKIAELFPSAS